MRTGFWFPFNAVYDLRSEIERGKSLLTSAQCEKDSAIDKIVRKRHELIDTHQDHPPRPRNSNPLPFTP